MELTELPESMLVIGGNATGLELAQLFSRLGVRVTIAEARHRLAPAAEPEVSAVIEKAFDDEASRSSPQRKACRCGVIPRAVRSR
jgi:mercuric reductase